MGQERRTGQERLDEKPARLWLLYIVCFVEGADMQLLPSCFRALEADIGLTIDKLAMLGLCQALAMSIATACIGILIDSGLSAKWTLFSGTAAWGVITLLLACVDDMPQMIVLRILNGCALATLAPVSQSIIAGCTRPQERGGYFGQCGMWMMLGSLASSLFAAGISNMTIHGCSGWRVAFAGIAILSLLLALTLAMLMEKGDARQVKLVRIHHEFEKFWHFLTIRSFLVLVFQGVFGTIPMSAMAFCTMFFQYTGMRDAEAAALCALMLLAVAIGRLLGGHIGDALASWSRYHGRPLAAQVSVISGIPSIILLFCVAPARPSSVPLYAFGVTVFGLTTSWCYTGVNRPILTEIVPKDSQARVISWLAAAEGASAACFGAPICGILATKVFHYQPMFVKTAQIPETVRQTNAQALASALAFMCIVPWCICFVFYSMLHFFYKSDVECVLEAHLNGDADENEALVGSHSKVKFPTTA